MIKKLTFITTVLASLIFSSGAFADPLDGWIQNRGTWYYYSNGTMLKGCWVKDYKGWTFLDPIDGSWVQQGWEEDSKGWCYIENGYSLDHAAWVLDSKGWQYISSDGYWDSSVPSQFQSPIVSAEDYLKNAENSKSTEDVELARSKINKLNDALQEKQEFLKRLAAIEVQNVIYQNTFSYSSIKNLIMENSPTVISNDNSQSKVNATYDSLGEQISSLEDYANKIKDDPNMAADYFATLSQITALENQRDKLISQTTQINMADNLIVANAEKLILTYNSMNIQMLKINENINSLERNIDMQEVFKSQGMARDTDIDNLKINLNNLNNNKNSIITQMEYIKSQLNHLIGKPYDDSAKIVFNSNLLNTVYYINMNKAEDEKTAVDNNFTLKLKSCDISTASNALNRASSLYGTGSSQYSIAEYDYYNALLAYDDAERLVKLKLNQLYEAVLEGQAALKLEESKLNQEKTNLDAVRMKYVMGMISKKDYEDEVSVYNLQSISVESLKNDVFIKYRTYQWMLEGVSMDEGTNTNAGSN